MLADARARKARGDYNTPTISNAIELFDVRPRHTGFLPHQIRCLLPELGPIVGYAVTAQTRAGRPAGRGKDRLAGRLLAIRGEQPGPKIAVGWDIDNPPGLGAQFGEVTATIHQKLGCVGHITSGCPRDLDEVRALGFQLFGLNPCVSHAYVRLVDLARRSISWAPRSQDGDLIHADKHGVLLDSPRDRTRSWRKPVRKSSGASGRLLESCCRRSLLARRVHQAQGCTHAKTHE